LTGKSAASAGAAPRTPHVAMLIKQTVVFAIRSIARRLLIQSDPIRFP